MGEYSNFPAEYAEVTSFQHTPNHDDHYNDDNRNNSPAPYATSSIINTSSRRTNYRHNSHHNMYFTNDLYPLQANRTTHSDTYYNPNEMINITENKLCNGMYTYNPNLSVPQPQHHQTPTVSKRIKKPLKLDCMIQSRLDFKDDVDDMNQYHHQQHQQQENPNEQLYVKVGECRPSLSSEVYMN